MSFVLFGGVSRGCGPGRRTQQSQYSQLLAGLGPPQVMVSAEIVRLNHPVAVWKMLVINSDLSVGIV
jgi:hypothetical protein